MTVNFYEFNKQLNSTALPTVQGSDPLYTIECQLKEQSSVVSPVLVVDWGVVSPVPGKCPDVNYCEIGAFFRYYFIQNMVNLYGDTWEIQLESDVMANSRRAILQSFQFVERSEVSSNPNIPDKLAIGTSQYTVSSSFFNTGVDVDPFQAVVEIKGTTNSFYSMTISTLAAFLEQLFSDTYLSRVNAVIAQFPDIAQEVNPLQYIQSIRLYPFIIPTPPNNPSTNTIDVGYGYINTSRAVDILEGFSVREPALINNAIGLISHPDSDNTTQYLNASPYTRLILDYPPFGQYDIDPGLAYQFNTIRTSVRYDIITGEGELRVTNAGGALLASAYAKVGIDLAVSEVVKPEMSALNIATSALGVVTNTIMGNISGAITGAASTLENFLGSQVPYARTTGNNGAWGFFTPTGALYHFFQRMAFPSPRFVGYPLYKRQRMDTVQGGYVKCINAEIKALLTRQESDRVEEIMNGGFYLV